MRSSVEVVGQALVGRALDERVRVVSCAKSLLARAWAPTSWSNPAVAIALALVIYVPQRVGWHAVYAGCGEALRPWPASPALGRLRRARGGTMGSVELGARA